MSDVERSFGNNAVSMSDVRAENSHIVNDDVRSEDLEVLKREEEEELSSITHPEEGIFTNLLQFLEESSKNKISLKTVTGKEDDATELLQNMKPTPQDVMLGPTAALSSASAIAIAQSDKSPTNAADDGTNIKFKGWIWDELDSACHSSECLYNSQMLPYGTSQNRFAVEEKERSFQSLVAKVKALQEELSEKEKVAASLEFSLNKSISGQSSRILKQTTNWHDIIRKQDLDYEHVSPKVHFLPATCSSWIFLTWQT